MPSDAKKSKRPIVFFGVGLFNTLIDFGFYTVLTTFVFKNGHNIAVAGVISGTFAMMVAFVAHSLITWRGTNISHQTVAKFFIFTGIGLWLIRPVLLSLFIKWHGLYSWAHQLSMDIGLPFSYNFIANTGAFGFAAVIVLFYNYAIYDRYVFDIKASRIDR